MSFFGVVLKKQPKKVRIPDGYDLQINNFAVESGSDISSVHVEVFKQKESKPFLLCQLSESCPQYSCCIRFVQSDSPLNLISKGSGIIHVVGCFVPAMDSDDYSKDETLSDNSYELVDSNLEPEDSFPFIHISNPYENDDDYQTDEEILNLDEDGEPKIEMLDDNYEEASNQHVDSEALELEQPVVTNHISESISEMGSEEIEEAKNPVLNPNDGDNIQIESKKKMKDDSSEVVVDSSDHIPQKEVRNDDQMLCDVTLNNENVESEIMSTETITEIIEVDTTDTIDNESYQDLDMSEKNEGGSKQQPNKEKLSDSETIGSEESNEIQLYEKEIECEDNEEAQTEKKNNMSGKKIKFELLSQSNIKKSEMDKNNGLQMEVNDFKATKEKDHDIKALPFLKESSKKNGGDRGEVDKNDSISTKKKDEGGKMLQSKKKVSNSNDAVGTKKRKTDPTHVEVKEATAEIPKLKKKVIGNSEDKVVKKVVTPVKRNGNDKTVSNSNTKGSGDRKVDGVKKRKTSSTSTKEKKMDGPIPQSKEKKSGDNKVNTINTKNTNKSLVEKKVTDEKVTQSGKKDSKHTSIPNKSKDSHNAAAEESSTKKRKKTEKLTNVDDKQPNTTDHPVKLKKKKTQSVGSGKNPHDASASAELHNVKKSKKEKTIDKPKFQAWMNMGEGLKVKDIRLGTGDIVTSGVQVNALYEGRAVPGGEVIDKNFDSHAPVSFLVGEGSVIKGLDDGVQGMREGGHRTIFIPSSKAYGKKGMKPMVKPDQDLEFDVEVLSITTK